MKGNAGRNRKVSTGLRGLLLAAGLILITGCMATELNERVLVSMVGLDQSKDGKIKVTVGLISPRKIELKEPIAVTVYSMEGETIFEAIRKTISKIGNQLLWPYIKIIVIGPSIAEKDVTPILDFFNRNNEVQPNPFIVMSHDPAEEIVKLKTDMSNLPAINVEQQIKKQKILSFAPRVSLYQFNEMMLSSEKVGYASLIKKERNEDKFIPRVEGMAVFKEAKWIGDLNAKETRGALWVQHEVDGGVVVTPLNGTGNKQNAKISLEIKGKNKSSIKPVLKKGNLSVTIEVKSTMAIGEVLGNMPNTQESIAEIKDQAEKQIKAEIESSLQKAQKKWKTDIYGINSEVHRHYPEYWKKHKDNWDNIFFTLPIHVKVDVEIKKMGLLESFSGK